MATKYILDPSGNIIKVVNGVIEDSNGVDPSVDVVGVNRLEYIAIANKGKSLETNLLNTGKINSEGIGPLVEVDSPEELKYIIDENSSNDSSFGFIGESGEVITTSTSKEYSYLPFNSFNENGDGDKPKVFADEFEMLTGLRYRSDERDDAFENALFMISYIAESLVRIVAVEAIILANRAINATINDSGNQAETAERYSLRLGKYDFTEFDIFTKYIYNILNYPHDSSSFFERLGSYFLGMSAWLSPDSVVDLNNIFKESRALTKYTNSIDQTTQFAKSILIPGSELYFPLIYSSAEVLVNAVLSTNSVNRSRLLIRKFYREKHWQNKVLYKAKNRNDTLDFFSDLNYYYFKFYIERVHVGLTLLKKYFYDDSYLRLRQKESPINRVSAARSVFGINTKIENPKNNNKNIYSWTYTDKNSDYKGKNFKARQSTSLRSLPQAFNLNYSFIRSLALNGKSTLDIGEDLLQNFHRTEERRLSPELVKEIENHLESEYMPFYFHDLRTNEILSFHAFIESITDAFSPEYNSASGFGRIDDVKSYVKTTRNINLSFIIAATSEADHDLMWYQINKIVAMVYPQWSDGFDASSYDSTTKKTENANFKYPFTQVPTASPLIRLRVGDVIKSNYSRTTLSRAHGVGDRESDKFMFDQDAQKEVKKAEGEINNFTDLISTEINTINKEAAKRNKLYAGKDPNEPLNDDEFSIYESSMAKSKDATATLRKLESEIKVKNKYIEEIKNKAGEIAFAKNNNKKYFLKPGLYRRVSGSFLESIGFGLSEGLNKKGSKKSVKIDTEVEVEVDSPKSLEEDEYIVVKYDGKNLVADVNKITVIEPRKITENEKALDLIQSETGPLLNPSVRGLSNNPITRSYESGMSRGLAGFITNLDISYNESTWETSRIGSKAPMLVKVNIGFSPIHDIPPGLDHNGMLRAPVYNVGRINNEFFGDPHDGNAGHGDGRVAALNKYNEIVNDIVKKP